MYHFLILFFKNLQCVTDHADRADHERIRVVVVPIKANNHYPMFTNLKAWGSGMVAKVNLERIQLIGI